MHRTIRKRAPARPVHRRVDGDGGDGLTAPTAPRSRASVKISSSSESCVALPSQDTSAIHGVVAEGQKRNNSPLLAPTSLQLLTRPVPGLFFREMDQGALSVQ